MHGQHWATWALAAGLLIALAAGASLLWPGDSAVEEVSIDLAGILRVLDTDAGKREPTTDTARTYNFPADHGPHPAHRTEIWDLRAVLSADDGRHIGLRATFLRLALAPADGVTRASRLAANELVAARIALSPDGASSASQDQRTARAVLGIAGSDGDPARVWIEDWGLAWLGEGSWQLRATVDSGAMELQLASGTAAGVLPSPFGSELEPRDATPSNVGTSGLRGYQMPRLTATGTVDTGTGPIPVSGPAWLDHGWGDLGALLGGRQGQLRANQFRVSLDDGAMLDCLELRRVGGGGTPVPSCALTASDGSQRHYQRRALSLLPEPPAWNAPGGTRFPLRWRLQIPPERLELSLTPLVEDQRLRLFDQPIWSGPVIVDGERAGTSVAGRGWMDLSGG